MRSQIIKITFLLCLFSHFALSQNLNDLEAVSPKHIQVKGTNVFMIPPPDFKVSEQMKGFQNPEDPTSMILVMEVPGPFDKIKESFTEENLEPRGMKLIDKKKLKVQEFEAIYLEIEQEANSQIFTKSILIYGDEQGTIMINGAALKDKADLHDQIKESIYTTFVDAGLQVSPRASLDYEVDESKGGLQFLNVMGNGMFFNRDAKMPTESQDQLVLITDKSFQKVEVENPKFFAIARLKKYPDAYELIIEKGVKEIKLDGLDGFALFARNSEKEDEEMYQCMLFPKEGGYYILAATYKNGEPKALEDAKAIIESFKRK